MFSDIEPISISHFESDFIFQSLPIFPFLWTIFDALATLRSMVPLERGYSVTLNQILYQRSRAKLMIYCAQRCDQKFWFIPAEKKNLSGLVQGNSNLNWKGIYFIYIQSWLFCAIDIYVYFLYLFWVFVNVIKNISVRANSLIIPVNWLKNYFNLSISVKWWQTSGKYSTAGASWNHLLWMRG